MCLLYQWPKLISQSDFYTARIQAQQQMSMTGRVQRYEWPANSGCLRQLHDQDNVLSRWTWAMQHSSIFPKIDKEYRWVMKRLLTTRNIFQLSGWPTSCPLSKFMPKIPATALINPTAKVPVVNNSPIYSQEVSQHMLHVQHTHFAHS